jgi:hypothetical protein
MTDFNRLRKWIARLVLAAIALTIAIYVVGWIAAGV